MLKYFVFALIVAGIIQVWFPNGFNFNQIKIDCFQTAYDYKFFIYE